MKDDRLYLIHIGECISQIEQYTAGGRDEFLDSKLIQDAVLRNLQTLSESTQRISGDFRRFRDGDRIQGRSHAQCRMTNVEGMTKSEA